MIYLGVCLLAAITGLPDILKLARQGRRRDLAAVTVVLGIGLLAALSRVARLPLPTIGEILKWLARPILGPM